MTDRLTPDREAQIRKDTRLARILRDSPKYGELGETQICLKLEVAEDLLAELDAVRAELEELKKLQERESFWARDELARMTDSSDEWKDMYICESNRAADFERELADLRQALRTKGEE